MSTFICTTMMEMIELKFELDFKLYRWGSPLTASFEGCASLLARRALDSLGSFAFIFYNLNAFLQQCVFGLSTDIRVA